MMNQARLSRGHNPCAIHILAGVLIVMFVALPYQILGNNNEPVCYLKTKLDKRNTQITKIDCAEASNFHWSQIKKFETRSGVSLAELLNDNDDIPAPITSFKTGLRQDQDSERTPRTAPENTSTKGTQKRHDDTKETSSIRSHSTSMSSTEKRQDKMRETTMISPKATTMAGTLEDIKRGAESIEPHATSMAAAEKRQDDAREASSFMTDATSMPATQKSEDKTRRTRSIKSHATWMPGTSKAHDDAGETTSITPHDVSMSATQKSQDDNRGTLSIKAHDTWMPGTSKAHDDGGETLSITPHGVSMLATQKSQDDTRGTSSSGSHTTTIPGPSKGQDDKGETKSIGPHVASMAATQNNRGYTRESRLTEAHATSMMEVLDTTRASSPETRYQTLETSSRKTTKSVTGTRYYYAFTFLPLIESECPIETVEIYIASLSSVTVSGTIFFPFQDSGKNISFTLAYGQGDSWELPLTIVPGGSNMNCTVNTTIVVGTNEMVTVVGHQRCKGGRYRSTAFRVRHIASLGTQYLLLTHRTNGITQAGIVALNDGTSVWINGSLQNLDKYEAYFLGAHFDVTGTNVTSNQPVAILVGNRGDTIPPTGKDAFFRHLHPYTSWGQRFLVPPFPVVGTKSYKYMVRILARYDGTNITMSTKNFSHAHANVMPGNVITRLVDSRHVLEVTSSKPILVAKFLTKVPYKCSMVFIAPINSSTVKSVVFQVLESTESAFINVWLPNGNKPNDLSFEGSPDSTWKLVGNDTKGNSIVQMSLTVNKATYTLHSSGNFGITAVVYGSSYNRYYSYPLP